MAEKLKIIPLGGLNEIGKNLTVYEYGNDIIIVDVGMGFPDDDMYGVDVVIPDVSYLIKHQDKIRGIFLTHGHEDHIGALPYVLRSFQAPIYATRMTLGLVGLKLEEHKLLDSTKLVTCEAGDIVKAGKFSVEFIHANHSIADAVSFAIKCPVGTVIHTGDFKIDPTPIKGKIMDLTRLGELGKEGVLALLCDSTNVERPGYTRSERAVGNSFDALFRGCKERIIVTTFASNVDRIQQIINVAASYGRKVAITGRSMENSLQVATELGYTEIPKGVLVDLNHIKSLPKDKVCIITTGSQGEAMSALFRIAFSTHRQVGIPDPAARYDAYPRELSGGLRQRVMIAMAMACEPELLLADEPTTALDVTIQAQILSLMGDLRREHGTAILLITHNLGVVAQLCDLVYVMYAGQIVEAAETFALFREAKHPYTQGLRKAIPALEGGQETLYTIRGTVPDLRCPPPGCRFCPRCDRATEACAQSVPPLRDVGGGHFVRCFQVT